MQWLCIVEKSNYNINKRLKNFFVSLYKCLNIGARCAFQFYPANPEQLNLITKSALEYGFTGGVVIDFPHSTKKKKYYLFLQAGFTKESIKDVMDAIPKTEIDDDEEDEKVDVVRERRKLKNKNIMNLNLNQENGFWKKKVDKENKEKMLD